MRPSSSSDDDAVFQRVGDMRLSRASPSPFASRWNLMTSVEVEIGQRVAADDQEGLVSHFSAVLDAARGAQRRLLDADSGCVMPSCEPSPKYSSIVLGHVLQR